ncbi:hypothetical protein [Klebsiella sp. BIGb0407]|uniref:hypothetical protein n=1 Tax=Klebsiella sp. BIGb0407 TaxID=2940603 RepID=UPI0021689895|nr:hypothetical protein [Klebsiella sp. BIGb0407]MCS3430024.1 hypothetical protein [Klebsiella sp. BIGb0407]
MNNDTIDVTLNRRNRIRVVEDHERANDFSGGGGGDDMLQRIKDLEVKVSALTTDIAVIKDKIATKEDIQAVKTEIHKELGSQTWKIVLALVITVTLAVLSKYFIK